MNLDYLLVIIIGSGILALAFALWKSIWVSKQDCGNEKM